MPDDFRALNEESRKRLATLVAALQPADYAIPVGEGWTVASVLAHTGFWDRWQAARWRQMLAGAGIGPAEEIEPVEELANAALHPIWCEQTSTELGRIAVEAAEDLDALIAAAPPEMAAQLDGTANEYLLRRYRHRTQHVEQVERALKQ